MRAVFLLMMNWSQDHDVIMTACSLYAASGESLARA